MSETTGAGGRTTDSPIPAATGTTRRGSTEPPRGTEPARGAEPARGSTSRSSTEPPRRARVVQEAYSFACLRCGHGWEQTYDIEHHLDAQGKEFVVYKAEGRRVPSPLSQPTCANCDGHVVRIMRPGRVSTVLDSLHDAGLGGGSAAYGGSVPGGPRGVPEAGATDSGTAPRARAGRAGRHLWHVSNLVRLLHLQRRVP
jgi:hypothetical protein